MDRKSTSEDVSDFLTTGQFSRRTRLSVASVKRMCDAGQIASIVVSDRGDRRIPASEVDRMLAEAEQNRARAHS